MRSIVQSDSTGNGKPREYNPEVEFEYLDADVWIKTDAEGQDVAYTQDVLEAWADGDEEPSANGDSGE